MAKKRPSGDAPEEGAEIAITPSTERFDELGQTRAAVAPVSGGVAIDLLDDNGQNPLRICIDEREFGREVIIGGIRYRHVSDADGVWQFMV